MKNWLVLILSILLVSSLIVSISAVSITLQKSNFYPSETLQANISGGFIGTISINNIGIYKEGSAHVDMADSGLIKYNNNYYFYAKVPSEPGKYSLRIENTNHYEGSTPTTNTIETNFTVTNSNSSYLSFTPGYILTTKNTVQVIVTSYNDEQQVSVTFDPTSFSQTFNLIQGNENSKKVSIPISGNSGTLSSVIKINSYTLPVFAIFNSTTPEEDLENITIEHNLSDIIQVELEGVGLNVVITKDKDWYFPIDIRNTRTTAFNIDLNSTDKELHVSPSEIIGFNGTRTINLTINSSRSFEGSIIISYGKSIMNIPIQVTITNNESNFNSTPISVNELKTCAQLNGKICNYEAGESCDSFTYDANNKPCCLSGCKGKSGSSSTWIWGILLIIILGVGGWYVYKKQKKKPESQDLSKRVEEYKKRMGPEPINPETHRSLVKE